METSSLAEFRTEAVRFARSLAPRAGGATVVALSGNLGAGKTTFVQAVAEELGVVEPVRSPTFIIMQVFEMPGDASKPSFVRLIHIDAYRLTSPHELEVLGWKELVADPGNLVFIEWPSQVPGALPEGAQKVTLSGEGDIRSITYGS